MGFDLASMVIFSPHFLNCKSGDVYVDADGGRGNTEIVCKLVSPDTRAVSVEIDESRHEATKDWLERIIGGHGKSKIKYTNLIVKMDRLPDPPDGRLTRSAMRRSQSS
jgi:hypothetical protein